MAHISEQRRAHAKNAEKRWSYPMKFSYTRDNLCTLEGAHSAYAWSAAQTNALSVQLHNNIIFNCTKLWYGKSDTHTHTHNFLYLATTECGRKTAHDYAKCLRYQSLVAIPVSRAVYSGVIFARHSWRFFYWPVRVCERMSWCTRARLSSSIATIIVNDAHILSSRIRK